MFSFHSRFVWHCGDPDPHLGGFPCRVSPGFVFSLLSAFATHPGASWRDSAALSLASPALHAVPAAQCSAPVPVPSVQKQKQRLLYNAVDM